MARKHTETTEFKKYSSIENIRKSSEVLQYELVATEKLHGTNVRFFWDGADLHVGSRNNYIWKPNSGMLGPQFDGYKFYDYIYKHPFVKLCEEWSFIKNYTFYGEWHGEGVQKGVQYTLEGKDLRIFDIRHPEGYFLNWDETVKLAKQFGFKLVPELFRGKVMDVESLNKLLDVNSQCAIENGVKLETNIAEGIVLKPLKEVVDRRGNRVIIKYKSKKWAENAGGAFKISKQLTAEEIAIQTAAREFASQVLTPGRIATIAEHITRDGDIELSMKRTPDFLRELVRDIMKEYAEEYAKLERSDVNIYNKTISRQSLPLWRNYLGVL